MIPIDPGPAPAGYRKVTWAKDQPEYRPLPALVGPKPEHRVVTCWKLTWRERLAVLLGVNVWLQVLTFTGRDGRPNALQPQLPTIGRPDLESRS